MAKQKLNEKALGYSLAILAAIGMFLTWIGGLLGWYQGWVDAMIDMHTLFSLNVVGLIGGIVEAGIISFITGWLIAWVYNKYV